MTRVNTGMTRIVHRWPGGYFGPISAAARKAIEARVADPATTGWQAEYDAARLSWHVGTMSAIGLGGLLAILWLSCRRDREGLGAMLRNMVSGDVDPGLPARTGGEVEQRLAPMVDNSVAH